MTATPIPRTLALTVYGDLDISVIRELPKGRQPIATYWVEEAKRERIYSFIEEELAKGRQAYIVYPRIEESEEKGMRSARRMYETLAKGHFRTYRLGLLHGKMSSKDKDSVMADFKNGEIDILVATVVIEVGIDVPNASVMLIENAERFGLAQLHQLRGRIGRGDHESYCILLADPKTENAKARLKAIEETVDGFEIAEEDLDLRGPGEFFGTSQHGLPEIRFGNIIKDFAIMKAARDEAFGMIGRDPELKEERHRLLRDSFVNRFRGRLDFARTG
jgi:ATP-dependent DNA helicase RecG